MISNFYSKIQEIHKFSREIKIGHKKLFSNVLMAFMKAPLKSYFLLINFFRITSLKLNEETTISITFKAPKKE